MNRGKVNVVLRVKPREDNRHSDRLTVLDSEKGGATVILKKSNRTEELFQYQYHRALENASQETTYQVCGEEVINACLEGYNGTIMAYGQTGAGKTFSMFGPEGIYYNDEDYHGIMPRAIQHVFEGVQEFLEWNVKMTFVEIYNETFRDLLTHSRAPISVQDNSNKARGPTSLKGVTPVNIRTADHAFELLLEGQEARSVAAHAMNDRSSRSHAIMTLWIEITTDDGRVQKSKLNMVDLAGSERTRKTGAAGTIAKEATFINKSLSCLSMVAKELRKKSSHVHYRDSKLTHYLKDSLGGNCRTLMIACVWGDANHLNESLSTCRFADDIQQVEVNVIKNSGVESVHRNLFKMNPAMTKYIDQMMTKRVAQEKAKMFRDLKRRGLVADIHNDAEFLDDGDERGIAEEEEGVELQKLRRRVKELEDMETTKRKWGVGREDTVEELRNLREKVSNLEAEKEEVQYEMARRMKSAESNLLEEMQELRIKVCELQKIRALTESESSELYTLREQMAQVAGNSHHRSSELKKAYKTWHPMTHMSNCDMMVQDPSVDWSRSNKINLAIDIQTEISESDSLTDDDGGQTFRTVEEQARVVGQLEGLRDRLRELHDVAVEKLTQDNFDELASIREKIVSFQSRHPPELSSRDNDRHILDDLEIMRSRLKELQSLPVDQMTPDDLRELALIKDKIVSLQSSDRVQDMLSGREAGQLPQSLATYESAGMFLESSSGTTPSVQHERPLTSSQLHSLLDSSQFRSQITSPRDRGAISPGNVPGQSLCQSFTQHISLLDSHQSQPAVGREQSTSNDRTQMLSYIPPFPGSRVEPQPPPENYDASNESSTLPSTTNPGSGHPTRDIGCFTYIGQRPEKKKSLKEKVSKHLWNLVSFGKLNAQEKEREPKAEESMNIVILNSLTHSQVLELLRDRYASRPCMGSNSLGGEFLYDSKTNLRAK